MVPGLQHRLGPEHPLVSAYRPLPAPRTNPKGGAVAKPTTVQLDPYVSRM